jgi:hypothetical protein
MRAHRTDPVSLTFGLIFLASAAAWLVGKIVSWTIPDVGWFVAGLLIVAGVLGLLGALRAGRSSAAPAAGSPDTSAPITGVPNLDRTDAEWDRDSAS